MKLVFVHGWSVTSTQTYGELPQVLARLAHEKAPELAFDIAHIHLGRYISFDDAVTLDDVAIAFEAARLRELGDVAFAVIAHSTGGPLIRAWVDRYYGARNLSLCPLTHLVMLAPANHGSALAQLGKSRLGRLSAWFDGVEPGKGFLDWLELGSDGQHALNLNWLGYSWDEAHFYPFVLTGETVDGALYDYLNSYTGEPGSDGVVRVASANLNYQWLTLVQTEATTCQSFDGLCVDSLQVHRLAAAPECAFEVIPRAAHSQEKLGIMNSVRLNNYRRKPVVDRILACLAIDNGAAYGSLCEEMRARTDQVQRKDKYACLVVRVRDDLGNKVNDFDFYLLSGDDYLPGNLPRGFLLDKQKNRANGNSLSLYLNATRLAKVASGKIGFKIVARPDKGFSRYRSAEFHSDGQRVAQLLRPNQTLMLDIVLTRSIAANSFSFVDIGTEPDFKGLEATKFEP
jgi:hypothetical protein